LAQEGERFALCLISERMLSDWVFTLGDEELLDQLLPSLRLPARAFLTCQPEHLVAVQRHYKLEWHHLLKRMVAERESFNPIEARKPEPLQPREAGAVNELYQTWGYQTLSPGQLRKGVYYGVWQDGQLISAAGTLFISPTYGLACLGNVLTRPSHRNQGLATACTSAVTRKLFETCQKVVLDVEPGNRPAIKIYSKLGYRDGCFLVEALGERRRFLPALLASFWRKLGVNPT